MSDLFMAEVESFLAYVDDALSQLPVLKWDDLEREAGGADNIAVLCVDLTNAFAKFGSLASPRVAALIEPVVRLFRRAHERGVRKFVLPQDCHPPDSPEFEQYGPHAMCGTDEWEMVQELKELPFSSIYQVMPKTSLSPALETELPAWLERERPRVVVVAGDCTDLCVYQSAMYLKLRANARKEQCGVVVPRDCVDTYDVSVEAARRLGMVPHPGELMHRLFLYHMMLNGVRVAQGIE